ncbi:hypothetical protein IAQ61_010334 [Plenodomus lingam]|uniref:uncharacterized protein n=1 Tax=Leptosphaeria maculans TaxID=5022 RepID=UPI00332B2B2A|nr:hypothetical protein IAQ61_010334 [Plenodomus lingam]
MARFAQKVRPFRSTDIHFASTTSIVKSKYCPDLSFGHEDAKFPGVVIEVGYSQDKKSMSRKAENYILNSNANIRVVIGLDLAYSIGSLKATFSIWRPRLSDTAEGRELVVVEEIADMAFRDDTGNPVLGVDLQFNVSEFTHNKLVPTELDDQDGQIIISGKKLYQYLEVAESKPRRELSELPLPADVKKRK